MPIGVQIDRTRNLVIRTASGAVTIDEYLHSIQEVLAHPDFSPGMKSISDLREAASLASPQELRKISKILVERSNEITGGRVAIVVSRELAYGMSRMLQAYSARASVDIGVFYEMDEALDWLNTEESQI